MHEFGIFSGLKRNTSKTKAICFGPWRGSWEDQPFSLKWTKEPIRTLGIYVSDDENDIKERNFTLKIRNVNINLDILRSRHLSLFERVLIIQSVGVPHVITPHQCWKFHQRAISSIITTSLFDFIWRKKN